MNPITNNTFAKFEDLVGKLEGTVIDQTYLLRIRNLAEGLQLLSAELREAYKDALIETEPTADPIVTAVETSINFSEPVMALYKQIVPETEHIYWRQAGGLIVLALIEARLSSVKTFLTKEQIANRTGLAVSTVPSCKMGIENRLVRPPYYLDSRRGGGWRLGKRDED